MSSCCGCHLASDYGTSLLTGDGSTVSPFVYNQVDPAFERPFSRIVRATDQIISNNSSTPVAFSSAEFDSNGMFSLVNPSRLTVSMSGLYLTGSSLRWAQSSAQRETFFRLNGSLELDRKSQYNTVAQVHDYSLGYTWFFETGDYVEVLVFQLSGGNLNLLSSGNLNFWMMYLGKKNG